MIFCPSTNPPTNQKLTKSLTKIVETGTPQKRAVPKRGGTQSYYQLFCNEHATTRRRSAGREAGSPSLNATLRSREREGKVSPPCAPWSVRTDYMPARPRAAVAHINARARITSEPTISANTPATRRSISQLSKCGATLRHTRHSKMPIPITPG